MIISVGGPLYAVNSPFTKLVIAAAFGGSILIGGLSWYVSDLSGDILVLAEKISA